MSCLRCLWCNRFSCILMWQYFSVFYDMKIEDVIFLKKLEFDIVFRRILLKKLGFLRKKNHIIAINLLYNYYQKLTPPPPLWVSYQALFTSVKLSRSIRILVLICSTCLVFIYLFSQWGCAILFLIFALRHRSLGNLNLVNW